MMLERALRLIQEMAASGAHLGYFLPLLAQLVPYYLAMALPAAFMIALVFLVSRLDETLELEAMLGSGVSLARIALPLTGFGLAVAAATLVAGGVLEPHGRYNMRMLRAEALHAARFDNLQPGAFYSPADGMTLLFRRRGADPGQVERLFVRLDLGGGRETVLTAKRAKLSVVPGEETFRIALEDGVSYQDGDRAYRQRDFSLSFRHYRLTERLPGGRPVRPRGGDQKELTVAELIRGLSGGHSDVPAPALEAELYSRLARSMSALVVPLLAIPLAFAAKKRRRGLGIALGGILLVAFHHGVNFVKNVTLDGSPAPGPAFSLLCGLFALLVLWLFAASRHLPSHGPLSGIAGGLHVPEREARPARPRRLRLPGGTLGHYVRVTLALWVAVAAATAVLLLQLVDFIERGDDFIRRGLGPDAVARHAFLRLPLLVQQTLAVAALGGAMLALLRLTRFSEMVAIRSSGLSLRRIVLMLAPVGLLLSGASLLLGERITPRSEVALAAWWNSTDDRPRARDRWFRIGGDIVRAGGASAEGDRLKNLTLYRFDGGGALSERITAEAASAGRDGWELSQPKGFRLSDGRVDRLPADSARWSTSLRPGEVRAFFAASPHIATRDALRSLAGSGPLAEGTARYETRLHRAAAEPLAPLVMLLLAAPLALASSRSGPSWPQLLFPIGAGMAFLVSDGILTVAAQTGMILPWIGAWAAPLIFGLLGASILVHSDS